MRTLGELDERFQFKSEKSRLVPDASSGSAHNGAEDSQFEVGAHRNCRATLNKYHAVCTDLSVCQALAVYTETELRPLIAGCWQFKNHPL